MTKSPHERLSRLEEENEFLESELADHRALIDRFLESSGPEGSEWVEKIVARRSVLEEAAHYLVEAPQQLRVGFLELCVFVACLACQHENPDLTQEEQVELLRKEGLAGQLVQVLLARESR